MITRTCPCGVTFQPRRKDQRYCSPKCGRRFAQRAYHAHRPTCARKLVVYSARKSFDWYAKNCQDERDRAYAAQLAREAKW